MHRDDVTQAVRLADAAVVGAQRRHVDEEGLHPDALAAANIFALVEDFLGSRPLAVDWLASRPGPSAAVPVLISQVVALVCGDLLWSILDEHAEVASCWQRRTNALIVLRNQQSPADDRHVVLANLVGMHQHHAADTSSENDGSALRMAGLAALTWRSTRAAMR